MNRLPPNWQLVKNKKADLLTRKYSFDDFKSALEFVNKVGELAEKFDHHPNIEFTWGKAVVSWWSHEENGVTGLDYKMAEETEKIFNGNEAK